MKKILLIALLATSAMINAAATGVPVSTTGGAVSEAADATPTLSTAHRRLIAVFKEQELDRTTTPPSFLYRVHFAGKSLRVSKSAEEVFTLLDAVYQIQYIDGLSEGDKAFARTTLEATRNPGLYDSELTSLVEQLTKEGADQATIEAAISELDKKYNSSFKDILNDRLAKYFDLKMLKGKLNIRLIMDPDSSVSASGTLCRGYTISLGGKSTHIAQSDRYPILLDAVVAIILSPDFSDAEKAPVKEAFNNAKAKTPTHEAMLINRELLRHIAFMDDSANAAPATNPLP